MNIIDFLEEYSINVSTEGKNIAKGWIGIQCLFCSDTSNHLGIRLSDLKCHCWRCGRHSIVSVIQEITGFSFKRSKNLIKTFETIETKIFADKKHYRTYSSLKLDFMPKSATDKMYKWHYDYLTMRKFYPFFVARTYELKFVGAIGKYKFRIVIPYYYNRICYSFTTRAVFDEMPFRYWSPYKADVPLTPKQMVYNIDNLKKGHDCIIFEGPFDVWKFGNGAVAISGLNISKNQIHMLLEKSIRNLYIFPDSDVIYIGGKGKKKKIKRPKSMSKAIEIAKLLKSQVDNCEIITSGITKDMGDMTYKQALEVRQALHFDENL